MTKIAGLRNLLAEQLLVTVFLLTGEQVTGVVDVAEPAEFTELPPVAA